jgi:sec-independent protein translocase protein TatB
MFYIFILESIGTAELLLIGLVALIIFGPRKLPELARMLGKARNEFRKTTDEFKETWTREVDFENLDNQSNPNLPENGNTIRRADSAMKNEIVAPQIKEISQADFQATVPTEKVETAKMAENNSSEKRDWL